MFEWKTPPLSCLKSLYLRGAWHQGNTGNTVQCCSGAAGGEMELQCCSARSALPAPRRTIHSAIGMRYTKRSEQLHFYLDTVSRNHNKEEQVEGVDRFQAVSRRTAKIAITELSTLLTISCSLQPDLTMNLLPLEICHITGTINSFGFYHTKVWLY